jgi:hypothetical protein
VLLQQRRQGVVVVRAGVLIPVVGHHLVEEDLKGRDEVLRTLVHSAKLAKMPAGPGRFPGGSAESGRRESNSRSQFGRLKLYH